MPAEPEPFDLEMTYKLNLQSRDQLTSTRSDGSILEYVSYVITHRYVLLRWLCMACTARSFVIGLGIAQC